MKGVSSNLIALTIIQASSAALPLLIFPYSLAVLGERLYANIVLTEAIAMLMVAIVLYSYEIEGVRKVAGLDLQRDRSYVSRVFSGIISIRMMLFFLTSPIALLIVWVLNPQLLPLMTCWLLLPLSYALQPSWLCQGLEDNVFLAVALVSARISAAVILFLFLNETSYFLVPLTVGGLMLIGVLLSLRHTTHHFQIRFERLAWRDLKQMMMSGRYLFASNLSVTCYRDLNVLILGVMGSPSEAISNYSIAEKIIKLIQAGIRPINQFYLPKVFKLTNGVSRPSPLILNKVIALTWPQMVVLAGIFLIAGLIYGYAEGAMPWVRNLAEKENILSLVSIMSIAAFAGVANYVLGMVGLSGIGESRYLFRGILFVGIGNLFVASLLIHFFDQLGAAISFVFSEVLLLIIVFKRYLKK